MKSYLSPRYRRRRTPQQQREFRDAQQRRVEMRHARAVKSAADEPLRSTRVVEIAIRDSHRPGTTLRLDADEGLHGWGRWRAEQDGARIGKRRFGKSRLAAMLAEFLT